MAAMAAGCGEETIAAVHADGGGECTTAAGERWLPLAVGTTWTYRVSDGSGGAAVEKTTTVEAFEDVGGDKAGTMAYRIRTEKIDGVTVSWQEDRCDAIARHRETSLELDGGVAGEESYAPYKLRVDESAAHTAAGATWTLGYTEVAIDPVTNAQTSKAKTETWTVEGVAEEVVVPAGTFTCLHVRKVGLEDGQSDKQFWFARGVGKVKEVGDQTEELAAFTIAAE